MYFPLTRGGDSRFTELQIYSNIYQQFEVALSNDELQHIITHNLINDIHGHWPGIAFNACS